METKQKGSPFSQLPKEKKKRILQAAIEVFAQNDYKHASTDEIASRAGISKGLLFYYFHDKKTLYFYLGEYLKRMIENHLKKEVLMGIDDFFDLLDYGIEGKLKLFEKMPWVLEFSVRMYYNTEKDISPVTKKYIVSMTNQMYDLYFSHIDTSRFRGGSKPQRGFADADLSHRRLPALAADERREDRIKTPDAGVCALETDDDRLCL